MKRTIAIVAGGDTSEFHVSLRSAQGIYSFIDKEKYTLYIVEMHGLDWHVQLPDGAKAPVDRNDFSFVLDGEKVTFDFAYITIHGTPGEDGRLQGYFDMLHIPYSCCGVLAASLTYDKFACNQYLKGFGVRIAESLLLRGGQSVTDEDVMEKIGLPCFIKPSLGGSSFGVTKVTAKEQIQPAITKAFAEAQEVVVEAFMDGTEITCGCYKTKDKSVVFPITEVVSHNEYFDYEAKYNGESDEITPARISDDLTRRVQTLTSAIYDILGAYGIIRVDYIITEGEKINLLEVNTTPGMTATSFWSQKMRACKTKLEFQKTFCYGLLWKLAKEATDGLTLDHTALPADKSAAYTYISNHRDIILDSGFLSILLVDQGMDTVEIAIGDNLLVYPWIKKFVRVNKSFIVLRALTMRQMLEASARMSRYMHYTISEKKQSIWIAQREGRAKDSNDRTQDSVLKMLAIGGEGDVIDRLMEMNIAPLAISYEYDPCDFLKAQEFQLKRDIEGYKKTTADDLLNMQTGLFGYKGRVHFQTGACMNDELAKMDRSLPKPELFARMSALIDKRIHASYRMYPNNYVAHDLLEGKEDFSDHYTAEDKQRFTAYIEQQLERISIPNKDVDFLRGKMLLMYANPLKNYLAAIKE